MRSAIAALAMLMLVSPIARAQQASNAALRIVVVEGEDAVNIIQQKTAVAPVIEVRDVNNLPVSGATVTFSLGPGASFGGSSTLTVVTNAAGQATATGLTPTAAGAIQIQATATFQGHTALATIAQSNVMTAAEVATTAGAGSGAGGGGGSGAGTGAGAGAGGGAGGISGMTLGIIGAAAGGTLVATQAAGGGSDSPSPTSSTSPGGSATAPTTPTTPAPTPSTPSSATYTGPFDGTYSGTTSISPDNFSCSVSVRNTGTATLRLQRSGNANSGELQVNGQQSVSAASCGVAAGLIPNAPFTWAVPVTGSGNTITFSQEIRDSQTVPGAGSYSMVASISFTGTISGNTVTGTLTQNSTVDYRGDGFTGRATFSGTVNLTLR